MINDYDHHAEFRAFTVNGDMVDVTATFNIDFDWEEDCLCGQQIEKKVYAVERGHISAWLVGKSLEYTPTEEDLKEWDFEIRSSIRQRMKRITA